ncbi:MAG: hypothetical protein FJW21_00740 [Acidimicrobiia bacterium]|nr:hypothetical protein [Acidimicrobiia bacterium]
MPILLLALLAFVVPAQSSQAPMAGGGVLFDQGKTWEEFLAAADSRPETWKSNAARSKPAPALVARLKAASADLRFVVVAVAACSDSVHTVPYVATLAREAGVPLRIVDPTVGKPVMDAFRTPDGRGATATVAVLRGDRIVAAWVERPVALQTWLLGPAASLPQSERMDRKFGWYEWDRGESTMAELVALVERHQ